MSRKSEATSVWGGNNLVVTVEDKLVGTVSTRPRQEVFENTNFGFVWALRQSQGLYHVFCLIPVFEYFLPGTSMGRRIQRCALDV